MNADLLLKLADMTETIPPEEFDINDYDSTYSGRRGCVLCHARSIGLLPKGESILGPHGTHQERLGISLTQGVHLFAMRLCDNTPSLAAARIRRFVYEHRPDLNPALTLLALGLGAGRGSA